MSNDIKTSDLYIEVELYGNTLHAAEETIYEACIQAEPDPKRQQQMRSYRAMGNELGHQMGIVWAMHELYRAQTEADILEVKTKLENYETLQNERMARLASLAG